MIVNGLEYRVIPGYRQYAVTRDGKSVIRPEGGKVPNREVVQRAYQGKMYVTLLRKDMVIGGELIDFPCCKPVGVQGLLCRTWDIPREKRVYDGPRGKDHHRYGKKATAETKLKMRFSKIGEKHPKFKGWYVIDGRRFASSYEAAEVLGLQPKTIYRRCRTTLAWPEFTFERKK